MRPGISLPTSIPVRRWLVGLAALLVTVGPVGCGGGGTAPAEPGPDTTVTRTEAIAALEAAPFEATLDTSNGDLVGGTAISPDGTQLQFILAWDQATLKTAAAAAAAASSSPEAFAFQESVGGALLTTDQFAESPKTFEARARPRELATAVRDVLVAKAPDLPQPRQYPRCTQAQLDEVKKAEADGTLMKSVAPPLCQVGPL